MVPINRLEFEINLVTATLTDVLKKHGNVFNTRSLRNTTNVVKRRLSAEGIGFLTKTLPKLGKALDRALSQNTPLSATKCGFSPIPGSQLPRFLGELFSNVLQFDGSPLGDPCVKSIRTLRQVLYQWYKYEIPCADHLEQKVIDSFIKTENDLACKQRDLDHIRDLVAHRVSSYPGERFAIRDTADIAREASRLLETVLFGFDPLDITPRHGPGAVATKQQLWNKFEWSNVSSRITAVYPFDAYFCASLGHVCDTYPLFDKIKDKDLPAKVILVPKDSRGPRLISCEPVDFQWIQQGIMAKLVQHVEAHRLTRGRVNFTDQTYNQRGALLGSLRGEYVTLDLKEASDRVSLGLVRLLFPPRLLGALEASRSRSTVLPNGKVLELQKSAPMGSALCFPVLALTIWSILAAGSRDTGVLLEDILVYGDDVIVPKAYAQSAIAYLESFGLLINRDKSCTDGFFRESCGVDAYKGHDVTPFRFRTVWSTSPSPDVYTSWIAYANSCYDRSYFTTYDYIVGELLKVYKSIPDDDMHLACPSLRVVDAESRPKRFRINHKLQKREWLVRDVKAPSVQHEMTGWNMLLRFFTESGASSASVISATKSHRDVEQISVQPSMQVRSYTRRRTSMLVRRWR